MFETPIAVQIDRLFRAAATLETAQEALTALYVTVEREAERAMVQRAIDRTDERIARRRTIERQLVDAEERMRRAERYRDTVRDNLERASNPDLSDKRRTPR
jgi:hypothetical protein